MTSLLDRPAVHRSLAGGSVAHVAVRAARGPHLTPALVAGAAGRLWFVAARDTVKVRSIRRRPEVSILLDDGSTAVVVGGDAAVLGPWPPGDAARLLAAGPAAALGVARYAWTHRGAMSGFLLDLLSLEPRALPLDRVLVEVTPRWMVAFRDGRIVDHWGQPPDRRTAGATTRRAARTNGSGVTAAMSAAPTAVRRALAGGTAALALDGTSGPVALPATVDRDGSVHVPAAAVRVTGAATGPGCLTLAGGDPARASRTAGLMARGTARPASPRTRDDLTLALVVDRVAWWRGFDQGGRDLRAAASAPRRARRRPAAKARPAA